MDWDITTFTKSHGQLRIRIDWYTSVDGIALQDTGGMSKTCSFCLTLVAVSVRSLRQNLQSILTVPRLSSSPGYAHILLCSSFQLLVDVTSAGFTRI